MKRNIFFLFITFLIGGALLYFVFEKVGTKEIWRTFLSFSPGGIFWVFLFTILSIFLGAWRWKVILKDRGYTLSLQNLFSSWLAGFSIAYFTPVAVLGDEMLKVYILKQKFSVPLKKATISVFLEDSILDGSIFLLTIIVGIVLFILKTMFIPLRLWMILLILSFPIGGLIFFYFRAFKSESMIRIIEKPIRKFANEKIANGIANYEREIFDFFKSKNKNMWNAVILSFLRGIVNLVRSWVLLWFLGMRIDIITAISIIAFTNLAYIFPLPAALGSHEILQAFSFSVLGLEPQSGVAFTLILRAFDVLTGLFGIFIVFRYGAKWIKEKINI